MGVESAFGIEISDEGTSRCSTVGDLYRLVLGLLDCDGRLLPGEDNSGTHRTLVSDAFFHVRQALAELTSTPIGVINPVTRLDGLLPRPWRNLLWMELGKKLGVELPPFRPWSTSCPIATVEGLAMGRILRHLTPHSTWSRDAVWERLRAVIVEEIQVDPDKVRPEARFVQDLGVD